MNLTSSDSLLFFFSAIAPGQSNKLLRLIQQPSVEQEFPESIQELIISLFIDTSDRSEETTTVYDSQCPYQISATTTDTRT